MRQRRFHFGMDFSSCSLASSAKTGQPKVWKCFNLGRTSVGPNISSGESPSVPVGRRLAILVACVSAHGQK